MLKISNIVSQIDSFVWGPVMLVLLVGTGVLSMGIKKDSE